MHDRLYLNNKILTRRPYFNEKNWMGCSLFKVGKKQAEDVLCGIISLQGVHIYFTDEKPPIILLHTCFETEGHLEISTYAYPL